MASRIGGFALQEKVITGGWKKVSVNLTCSVENRELQAWIAEHVKGSWGHASGKWFWFENKDDALMFKLVWNDKQTSSRY